MTRRVLFCSCILLAVLAAAANAQAPELTVVSTAPQGELASLDQANEIRIVDPEGKLAIDVDRANNEWRDDDGTGARAASKWSAVYLFWLQTLLEMHTVLG